MDKYLNWVCVAFLLLLANCTPSSQTKPSPSIQHGRLDLTQWSFEQTPSVKVKGAWEVYWQKLLTPHTIKNHRPTTFFDFVPFWRGKTLKGQVLSDQAHATFRTKVSIPTHQVYQPLAIKLRVSEVAYQLFIDGKLVGKIGKTGTTPATNSPIYSTNIYTFTPQSSTVEIVLQVSKYKAYVRNTMGAIVLGTPQALYKSHHRSVNGDFLLFGSLLIIALYHFSLFYFRRQTTSPIYFGLLCLIIAVRIFTLSQFNITELIPWFDFEWHEKFSHLTFYTTTLVLFIFIRSVFSEDFPRFVGKYFPYVVWPFIVLVILTKSRIFSQVLPVFQLITLVVILVGLYVIVKAVRNKRHGAKAFLLGYVAITVVGINDILYSIGTIDTGHLFPWGLFVFILSQAIALSGRFSQAFVQSEQLSQELNNLNQDLEYQVQSRTQSLEKIREELQLKNDNITASITYAQHIQDAILPRWTQVQQHLPDSFLMFHPKDLVSGDFYWFAAIGKANQASLDAVDQANPEKLILSAVDCTGHGVPGAFMSLIGNNLLNQIILERKIFSPEVILSTLNTEVKKVLKQHETHNRDGMDLALVVIDRTSQTMEFAGAKNPLYLLQNGELTLLKGNKIAIGGKQLEEEITYQKYSIDISHPTTFYLASDGFQDQFGGPNGRKFMVKAFRHLLFDVHHQPMPHQHEILERTLQEWKKDEEQVDDILVIGVKLN